MTRITRLLDRVKRLRIGETTEFCNIFAGLMEGRRGCSYWTQDRLREFSDTHPGGPRPAGALKVLVVGCPKIPESEWGGLGSQKYDADGMPIPSPERPCARCEFLIPAIPKETIDQGD